MDAAGQWPAEGVPRSPRGWLIQVAGRRMTEQVRSEQARRRREELVAGQVPADRRSAPGADAGDEGAQDDTLTLLFLCCHPVLSPASAIALTLRSVGGLTTGEIATAFLVPEATMGQRISRAKHRIKDSGVPFRMPDSAEWPARLDAVERDASDPARGEQDAQTLSVHAAVVGHDTQAGRALAVQGLDEDGRDAAEAEAADGQRGVVGDAGDCLGGARTDLVHGRRHLSVVG